MILIIPLEPDIVPTVLPPELPFIASLTPEPIEAAPPVIPITAIGVAAPSVATAPIIEAATDPAPIRIFFAASILLV